MNITERMILTVTGIGLILTITFTPSCIDSITDVNHAAVGERYCGSVNVSDVSRTPDVTFIEPGADGAPTIVMFTQRNVTVNTEYTIHGQVDMYHGELEIVVDRIRPLRP